MLKSVFRLNWPAIPLHIKTGLFARDTGSNGGGLPRVFFPAALFSRQAVCEDLRHTCVQKTKRSQSASEALS
ncbi:hypothetical protein CDN97_21335 [Pantoea sp. AMG 501]|nr:hypothetical protein CDN97_21335 [Pantoea sp. AMG 501]